MSESIERAVRKTPKSIVALAIGATAIGVVGAPADASHGDNHYYTDGSGHAIWPVSLGTNAAGGTTWGRNALELQTDIGPMDSTQWNDVKVTMGYTGPGAGGTSCHSEWSGQPGRCHQWHSRYKDVWENYATGTEWKVLGCHELGHSAALLHRGLMKSCMWPDFTEVDENDQDMQTYDGHDIESINVRINNQLDDGGL